MNKFIFSKNQRAIFIWLFIAIIVQISLWVSFFKYVPAIESIPYNVREIVGQGHQFVSALMISLSCYFVLGLPVFFTRRLITIKNFLGLLFFLITALFFSTVTIFLLMGCVPMECLHDIIGSQVLGWPWYWEMVYRFSGIFAAISSILIVSVLLVLSVLNGKRTKPINGYLGIGMILSLMFYSHWVIVINAGTDNLVELMARGGDWQSSVLLSLWFFTIGISASTISKNIVDKSSSVLITFVLIVLFVPIGFLFFKFGTISSLTKYGETFSALQFLLSPDRSNYLQGPILLFRYSLAHLACVFLISLNQAPFWILEKIIKKN